MACNQWRWRRHEKHRRPDWYIDSVVTIARLSESIEKHYRCLSLFFITSFYLIVEIESYIFFFFWLSISVIDSYCIVSGAPILNPENVWYYNYSEMYCKMCVANRFHYLFSPHTVASPSLNSNHKLSSAHRVTSGQLTK